ncbi:MAG: hypothetical protein QGG36_05570 [Pirellulaceae bacterium]|nr:hypothetical protein [Pirellulaceae bacterium]
MKSRLLLSALPCLIIAIGCTERPPIAPPIASQIAQGIDTQVIAPSALRDKVTNSVETFGVSWPPREIGRSREELEGALLRGELSVFETVEDQTTHTFRVHITLERPQDELQRVRWNEQLAFPEHSWMAQVRVWDKDRRWLWPNLPYLLRAHGVDRVERYGGVDPGKGVDNDFAAVLIRPPDDRSPGSEERLGAPSRQPMVSAEWYPVDAKILDGTSIVHIARSDDFRVRPSPNGGESEPGRLGVWLIYADFLDASLPKNWPSEGEYAGGVLAYFEISWRRSSNGGREFEIESLIPPSSTGFDWADWSTRSPPLEKNLELVE